MTATDFTGYAIRRGQKNLQANATCIGYDSDPLLIDKKGGLYQNGDKTMEKIIISIGKTDFS